MSILFLILIGISALAWGWAIYAHLQVEDWRFGAVTIVIGVIFLSELARVSYLWIDPDAHTHTPVEIMWEFIVAATAAAAVTIILGQMLKSHKAEAEALRKKEKRVRRFARLSPVGQFLTNAAGLNIFMNDKCRELTGLKSGNALGNAWMSAIHPGDRERVISIWREAVKFQTNVQMKFRFNKPGGENTWVQSQVIADVAEDGRFRGFIGTITELTAQKRAQDLYRALLEASPDAMIVLDQNGWIALVNAQAQTLFGYSRKEFLSKKIEDLIPARFRPKHRAHRKGFSRKPRIRPMGGNLDLYGLRRDGSEFAVEISLSSIESDAGLVVSAAIRDVTQRKNTERTLRNLQQEMNQASRWSAMGMLASTLAHELNQPMSAIMNYVRASQRILEAHGGKIPIESMDLMTKAIEQTDLAGKIVRNLWHFVEQGEMEYVIADINSVVREVSATVLSEMGRRDVNFQFRPSANLPSVLISRIQIQEVIENLLKNAMEAMNARNKHELIIETSLAEDSFVEVAVSDSGSGVSLEVADSLFMPFATTKTSGLGVGLAISHSIILGHGGRLWTKPKPGGGSVFHFTIPVAITSDDNYAN